MTITKHCPICNKPINVDATHINAQVYHEACIMEALKPQREAYQAYLLSIKKKKL